MMSGGVSEGVVVLLPDVWGGECEGVWSFT